MASGGDISSKETGRMASRIKAVLGRPESGKTRGGDKSGNMSSKEAFGAWRRGVINHRGVRVRRP